MTAISMHNVLKTVIPSEIINILTIPQYFGMAKIIDSLPQEQLEQAIEVEKPATMLELVRNKHRATA